MNSLTDVLLALLSMMYMYAGKTVDDTDDDAVLKMVFDHSTVVAVAETVARNVRDSRQQASADF